MFLRFFFLQEFYCMKIDDNIIHWQNSPEHSTIFTPFGLCLKVFFSADIKQTIQIQNRLDHTPMYAIQFRFQRQTRAEGAALNTSHGRCNVHESMNSIWLWLRDCVLLPLDQRIACIQWYHFYMILARLMATQILLRKREFPKC